MARCFQCSLTRLRKRYVTDLQALRSAVLASRVSPTENFLHRTKWKTVTSSDFASNVVPMTGVNETSLFPPANPSLQHLPGRPLTLADFSTSTSPFKMDEDYPGSPYQRQFFPSHRPVPAPTQPLRFPTGIWPSTAVRKRTSSEWCAHLLPSDPGDLCHGWSLLLRHFFLLRHFL